MAPPGAGSRGGKGSLVVTVARLASYDEPALIGRVLDLLAKVFPSFELQERAARRWGLRWDACSTPFVLERDGELLCHVGVLETPVVIAGREVRVGNVHAVATRRDHRRRGLLRAVMEEVLPWCDARYETLQLATDSPEVFTPFGFRPQAEHHFVLPAKPLAEHAPRARALDDPACLTRLLSARAPVSSLLGTRDRQVLLFNEARRPLLYAADLDVAVAGEVRGHRLVLDDVIGARVPALSSIVSRCAPDVDEVELHFAPDGVAPDLDAVSVAEPMDEDVLMVRGPFSVGGKPCKLPPTARC